MDDLAVERVLAPIDGGTGIDGRADEGEVGDLFRELRFQRKTIFRAEQKTAMGEDPGEADGWGWDTLAEVSRDYLVDHGKDLEAMAILIEAAVRIDGLAGFDRALVLLADLVEAWWDNGLYPVEDEEDGIEARFQPISGLSGGGSDKDGTLMTPLRRLLLAGDGGTELRYIDRVLAEGQLASAQTAKPDQRAALQAEAEAAIAGAEAGARQLGRRPLRVAAAHLSSAEAAWRRAVGFISERTKPRFPAASRVSDELRAMREWIESLMRPLPDDGGDADPAEVDAAADADGAATPADGAVRVMANAPFSIGTITRREDALRAIGAAADFFEKYEPSSPIGRALREADRRARLNLGDLLAELIPDAATRELFYWRSGIKPPEAVT